MSRQLRGALRAQVLVIAAVALAALMLVLALAVDLTLSYRQAASQRLALEQAREWTLSSLEEIKYSPDTARTVEEAVARALGANGFEGEAVVWVWEVPAASIDPSQRLIGICVELRQASPPAFGAVAGAGELETSDSLAWTVNPYSSGEAWRPAARASDRFVLEADGSSASLVSAAAITTESSLPSALRDAIADGMGDLG